MAALEQALGRQVGLAAQLHDAFGQPVGVVLFLGGVLGEFRRHRLGVQAAGHEEVALVAQHTDDLGGQRFVQQLEHGLAVRPGSGRAPLGQRQIPGDRRRRRRAVLGRPGRMRGAGRAAGRAGGHQLPAQRRLPGQPSAVVRAAGLPGLQGRHEAAVAGRRGAGAGLCAKSASDPGRGI